MRFQDRRQLVERAHSRRVERTLEPVEDLAVQIHSYTDKVIGGDLHPQRMSRRRDQPKQQRRPSPARRRTLDHLDESAPEQVPSR